MVLHAFPQGQIQKNQNNLSLSLATQEVTVVVVVGVVGSSTFGLRQYHKTNYELCQSY